MKLKKSVKNLNLFIFLFLSFSVYSQKEKQVFLKEVNVKKSVLTDRQTLKLKQLEKNNLHKNIKFVKVGNLPSIVELDNGWLYFTIPGYDSVNFIARPKRIIVTSKKNYEFQK